MLNLETLSTLPDERFSYRNAYMVVTPPPQASCSENFNVPVSIESAKSSFNLNFPKLENCPTNSVLLHVFPRNFSDTMFILKKLVVN